MDFFYFSPGRAFTSVGVEKFDQLCLRGYDPAWIRLKFHSFDEETKLTLKPKLVSGSPCNCRSGKLLKLVM